MAEPTLQELAKTQKETSDMLGEVQKGLNRLTEVFSKTAAPGHPNASQVFGAPGAIIGESPNGSRGFSFMKLLGRIRGFVPEERCKVEMELHDRLFKSFVQSAGAEHYDNAGLGAPGQINGWFLAPLAPSFMHDEFIDKQPGGAAGFRKELKQLFDAGTDGADQDHMSWIAKKQLNQSADPYVRRKALSWLNELTGGAIVAPPEMGELIELLRNKEALVNAGARVVPLPPQGRLKFPRQTAASLTYWVGENSPITESLIGTGEVTLQAKKLAVLIKAPNELIRFASPAAEALMRDDMTKSLALGLDLAGLEGGGGDTRPRGITNMPNINRISSSNQTANGDAVVGKDIYRMIAAVEESNAEFEGWIMRPKTLYKYYQLRSDSIAQGDQAGPWLFDIIREPGEGTKSTIAGHPVTKSTQVSQVRAKGNSTSLTYTLGGMWSDLLIGMFGAIEFAATTMGDTSFVNDQTWVRGILSADIQARHEAAFVLMDFLDPTLAGVSA